MTSTTAHFLEKVENAREHVFGLPAFRPGQMDAIDSILSGRDLLAVMPTGAGKSLCFQVPAVVHEGLTLVVSPLIALMKDQVDGLRGRDIRAAYLASGQSSEERRAVWRDVRQGALDLLYVSPERLRDQAFIDLITRANVWFVAVDEAHCISTWGSDFRPDYLRIPDAIKRLPSRPVIAAFTATATPKVQTDLVEKLGLDSPNRVLAGFDRPNLRFLVQFCRTPAARLDVLEREVRQREGTGIVYAGTRRATEEQAEFLNYHGRSALAYHAGLSSDERVRAQNAFMAGDIDVIVATNAFGLGIDKPDVRFVIHTTLPSSPDAYYQEAGRAGRDGLPADVLLLNCQSDRGLQEFLIGVDLPEMPVLQKILRYVGRSEGAIALDAASDELNITSTMLRVGLQTLAEAETVELGDRIGNEQAVSTTLTRLGRKEVTAIERALTQQRAWRIEQLDEIEGYVHSDTCRRAYLLAYFGDPAAAPRGDERCCDRCARPGSKSAGQAIRQAKAARLQKPRRLSAQRAALRDALIETGSVRGAANLADMTARRVGVIAREMVAQGVLDVDALVPQPVQAALADACRQMDAAGVDYRRPRPGYLQTAMQFCPPGTDWDHLALYLASERRREALEDLAGVEPEVVEQVSRPVKVRTGKTKASWEETLELFQAARSVEEISEERGIKPVTVENHLVEAIKAQRLDPQRVVDSETAEIVRQAIEQTPPSDTPLRDIRATAVRLAGRDVSYLAISAIRAQSEPPALNPELMELRHRKTRAETLRAERGRAGQPWPAAWEAEYRRILARIAELEG